MCGIAGIVFKEKQKDYITQCQSMISLIDHRGPDDNGILTSPNCILGHTRLSIIDTSSAGHQPMTYRNRYTITYNGEVFNYLELRNELEKEGYSFNTHSDTEVILATYDKWKEECVNKLNGMFAFAIYDITEKKLFCARDRAGVKPFYYYQTENEFYFCSEQKQLVFSNVLQAKPNAKAIRQYLAFQFTLDNSTFFENIYKLEPGHYAIYQDSNLTTTKYWDVTDIPLDNSITYENAQKKLKEILTDAVKLRLRSDVKVGSYLSGGIDSSIISSLASHLLPHIDTYTFTSKKNPRHDESKDAKLTAEFIGSSHHEIELELSDILKLWTKAIYHMDEPEVGYSLLPQMKISEEVAKSIKVILGGQGGDELFFGYGWHNQLILSNFNNIKDISFIDKIKIIINIIVSGNYRLIINTIRTKKATTLTDSYFNIWKSFGCHDLLNDKEELRSILIEKLDNPVGLVDIKKLEYKYWLRGLLHVEDRSSMAYSIESRVPLMDYRLVEFIFSLPPTFMINGTINKKIFIDTFKEYIPQQIASKKDKKGYASPIESWLKEKNVEDFIQSIFVDNNSFIYNFIERKYTPDTLNNRQLWLLASLELWYKIFITKEILNEQTR